MKIAKQVTAAHGGATYTFDTPHMNDWVIFEGKLNTIESIDAVLPKLRAIEGAEYDDGTPIPLEAVAAKEAPFSLYLFMLGAYKDAFWTSVNELGAEAKKERTPPSSDSSDPPSTTQG